MITVFTAHAGFDGVAGVDTEHHDVARRGQFAGSLTPRPRPRPTALSMAVRVRLAMTASWYP